MSRVAITNGIITLAEAKASIYGNGGVIPPTVNDSDIEDLIEAATPIIERLVGPIYTRSRTFYFDGGTSQINLPVRWRTLTSVTVDGTVTTAYSADPDAATITALGYFPTGNRNVVVVVVVGYATAAEYPPHVIKMARDLVSLWWQQSRNANRPGTAELDLSVPPMGFLVPNRVAQAALATPDLPGFA